MRLRNDKAAIFYQEARGETETFVNFAPRIRIIYPDGESHWFVVTNGSNGPYEEWGVPCWAQEAREPIEFKDRNEALMLMKAFDHSNRWSEAIFIGYL